MKQIADDIKHLEFVGYSLLDDESPIYKIKIPNGCEIVHQLDKYINEN